MINCFFKAILCAWKLGFQHINVEVIYQITASLETSQNVFWYQPSYVLSKDLKPRPCRILRLDVLPLVPSPVVIRQALSSN